MTEQAWREQMCAVGRRLYAKNMVAATDGNISVRLGEDRYLCTPSGVSKGDMQPEDMLVADGQGRKVEGKGKVTSEFFTHLAAYEERADITAVVHAHPPVATALTLVGIDMTKPIVPEVIMGLVAIPTAGYATPGTVEGSGVVREQIRQFDAVLLQSHGAITVGDSPYAAYLKLEKVEHTAQVLQSAYLLGTPRQLSAVEVEKLMRFHAMPGEETPQYPFL